jgi:hypothetical protein
LKFPPDGTGKVIYLPILDAGLAPAIHLARIIPIKTGKAAGQGGDEGYSFAFDLKRSRP